MWLSAGRMCVCRYPKAICSGLFVGGVRFGRPEIKSISE